MSRKMILIIFMLFEIEMSLYAQNPDASSRSVVKVIAWFPGGSQSVSTGFIFGHSNMVVVLTLHSIAGSKEISDYLEVLL